MNKTSLNEVENMPVFNKFKTSEINPESGLFLCSGCNEVIPLSKEEKFPPCADCGSATWTMVAVAGEAGKRYRTGTKSPASGLFICTNCWSQVIPIAKGNSFPPCASCKTGSDWQLIVSA